MSSERFAVARKSSCKSSAGKKNKKSYQQKTSSSRVLCHNALKDHTLLENSTGNQMSSYVIAYWKCKLPSHFVYNIKLSLDTIRKQIGVISKIGPDEYTFVPANNMLIISDQ